MTTSYGLGNVSAQNYLFYDNTSADYKTNSSLKPLKIQAYEVGYQVIPYGDLHVGITGFQNVSSDFIDSLFTTPGKKMNSDIVTLQRGVTLDAQWSVNKLKANAFLTVQTTKTMVGDEINVNASVPSYLGGLTGNYRTFLNKLRLDAGLYFYGSSTLTGYGSDYILPSKLLTNCKISYNVWDEHSVFFNGRNVLNNRKIETPFADQTKNLYMIGIDLVF